MERDASSACPEPQRRLLSYLVTERLCMKHNNSTTIEALIKKHSTLVYEAAHDAAEDAQSEEDVRIPIASSINAFISEAGLNIKSRHEYGLAGGRIDLKYAGVIVEYKNPNSQADKIRPKLDARGTQRLVGQIRGSLPSASR